MAPQLDLTAWRIAAGATAELDHPDYCLHKAKPRAAKPLMSLRYQDLRRARGSKRQAPYLFRRVLGGSCAFHHLGAISALGMQGIDQGRQIDRLRLLGAVALLPLLRSAIV